MDPFKFTDYKNIMQAKIEQNSDVVGYKTQLAKAAQCQKSFLSQVLNSSADLSMDHAANLVDYWEFDDPAADHFLDLVQLARSGGQRLRQRIERRLADRRKNNTPLEKGIADSKQLDWQHQAEFYSHWHVSAVYMLMGVINTPEAAAERLSLPEELVRHVIDQLMSMGLVENKDGKLSKSDVCLWLRQSPYRQTFRSSWRQVAQYRMSQPNKESKYSTVLWSLSKADGKRIRETIEEAVGRCQQIALHSPEEDVVCFNYDLFSI